MRADVGCRETTRSASRSIGAEIGCARAAPDRRCQRTCRPGAASGRGSKTTADSASQKMKSGKPSRILCDWAEALRTGRHGRTRSTPTQADRHRLLGRLVREAGRDRAQHVERRGGEQPLLGIDFARAFGSKRQAVGCVRRELVRESRARRARAPAGRRLTSASSYRPRRRGIRCAPPPGPGSGSGRPSFRAARCPDAGRRSLSCAYKASRSTGLESRRVIARAVPVARSGMTFTPAPCRLRKAPARERPSRRRTGAGRATALRQTRRRPGSRAPRPAGHRRRTPPRRATSE